MQGRARGRGGPTPSCMERWEEKWRAAQGPRFTCNACARCPGRGSSTDISLFQSAASGFTFLCASHGQQSPGSMTQTLSLCAMTPTLTLSQLLAGEGARGQRRQHQRLSCPLSAWVHVPLQGLQPCSVYLRNNLLRKSSQVSTFS